jgi:hypothetical protein
MLRVATADPHPRLDAIGAPLVSTTLPATVAPAATLISTPSVACLAVERDDGAGARREALVARDWKR